jgi:hypothetical protein
VANLVAAPGADGRISLREAIRATNVTPGLDVVTFGIPLADANHRYYANDGTANSLTLVSTTTLADTQIAFDPDYPAGLARSWYRIRLNSELNMVGQPLTLDATTQPGYLVGGPVIELDAANALQNGLYSNVSSFTVRGFVVHSSQNNGIKLDTGSGAVIAGNYVGTDVSGTLDLGNAGDGIDLDAGASNHTIGGTTPAERNLVSATARTGSSSAARAAGSWSAATTSAPT